MGNSGARPRALPLAPRPRILPKGCAPFGKNAGPYSAVREDAMRRCRRVWRAILIALVGAGALSGCYYDPYTGYWYGYPPYPYPYPGAYPYAYRYPYPYPSPTTPAPGYGQPGYGQPGTTEPPNGPVQRAPL